MGWAGSTHVDVTAGLVALGLKEESSVSMGGTAWNWREVRRMTLDTDDGWRCPAVEAVNEFRRRFGGEPMGLVVAPGRVELLGNHTDYNQGPVLGCAIDRFTVIAWRPSMTDQPSERLVRVVFATLADDPDDPPMVTSAMSTLIALESPLKFGCHHAWAHGVRYLQGALATWHDTQRDADHRHRPTGFDAVITGNLPMGSGLSSSASLLCGLLGMLAELGRVGLDRPEDRLGLARLARQAEHRAVGVACGLLDPACVLLSRSDHALMLDCSDETITYCPLIDAQTGRAPCIVLVESFESRRLAEGLYNRRRDECGRALAALVRCGHAVASLREIDADDLDALRDAPEFLADPTAWRRARHVAGEVRRVLEGADALVRGDVTTMGRLMSESHESSRSLFENSSPALDALIDAARDAPGFLGGKLTGAGWGGCVVCLVRPEQMDGFCAVLIERATRRLGRSPGSLVVRPSAGARVMSARGLTRT